MKTDRMLGKKEHTMKYRSIFSLGFVLYDSQFLLHSYSASQKKLPFVVMIIEIHLLHYMAYAYGIIVHKSTPFRRQLSWVGLGRMMIEGLSFVHLSPARVFDARPKTTCLPKMVGWKINLIVFCPHYPHFDEFGAGKGPRHICQTIFVAKARAKGCCWSCPRHLAHSWSLRSGDFAAAHKKSVPLDGRGTPCKGLLKNDSP